MLCLVKAVLWQVRGPGWCSILHSSVRDLLFIWVSGIIWAVYTVHSLMTAPVLWASKRMLWNNKTLSRGWVPRVITTTSYWAPSGMHAYVPPLTSGCKTPLCSLASVQRFLQPTHTICGSLFYATPNSRQRAVRILLLWCCCRRRFSETTQWQLPFPVRSGSHPGHYKYREIRTDRVLLLRF